MNVCNSLTNMFQNEILRAAVLKYGESEWLSITSIFHTKTSAECKSHWQITVKEDDKILKLAKLMPLMPSQWESIAPSIGKTTVQCVQRYEYLL